MSLILAKAIKRKKALKVTKVRFALLNELRHQGVEARALLDTAVEYWNGDTPSFGPESQKISLAGGKATLTIAPTGTEMALNKWLWLNEGTALRWALMHEDFGHKTEPGRLNSTPGNPPFNPVVRGRRAFERMGWPPMPGIEARKFTKQVIELRKDDFKKALDDTIRKNI